jgi:hypothetical protein
MPIETRLSDLPILIHAQIDLDVIAAQWVVIRERNIMRVKMSAVRRVFIMFNNDFAIEIVHNLLSVNALRPFRVASKAKQSPH